MMLVASSILIAGIMVAGCSDSSSSVDTATLSPIPSLGQADKTTNGGDTGTGAAAMTSGDSPQFNESAGPMGTPPDGMQMNGTRPSGTRPDGMQMNGTGPSGTPPDGMQMNGTRPSGTPPDGMQMDGNGPSGIPPSGS
jgi:hypothetical protein